MKMLFNELELYRAIREVRAVLDKPGELEWSIRRHEELIGLVYAKLASFAPFRVCDFTGERILEVWVAYRKDKSVERNTPEEISRADLVMDVVEQSGGACFWRGRLDTLCSEEVTINLIVPSEDGGRLVAPNCLLTCTEHSKLQKGKSLESVLNDHAIVGIRNGHRDASHVGVETDGVDVESGVDAAAV